MSSTKSALGFDSPTIRVIVISNKRLDVKVCRVQGNKAKFNKQINIGFRTSDVGAIKMRTAASLGQKKWVQAIMWRDGLSNAIPWEPALILGKYVNPSELVNPEKVEEIKQQNNGSIDALYFSEFIPPLTQDENAEMIKRMNTEAKVKKKMLTNGQFLVLVGILLVVVVLLILVIAGVHINAGTSPNYASGNY